MNALLPASRAIPSPAARDCVAVLLAACTRTLERGISAPCGSFRSAPP